jgi:hypothetical protein
VPHGTPIDTTTPGEHVFQVDAEDVAGNTGSGLVTYTVFCVQDEDCDQSLDTADNCPAAANRGQENFDAAPLDNGPGVPGDDTTVPNGDGLGDVCDDDDDNDGLPDAEDTEPLGATGICAAFASSSDGHAAPMGNDRAYSDGNPASWDTDGDAVPDGRECIVGTNPRVADGAHRTACAATVAAGDTDGDGLEDAWEVCGWGTSPNNTNTDRDEHGDCVEAMDLSGNGTVNNVDSVLALQHFFGVIVGDLSAMDVNRNGAVSVGDASLISRAFFRVSACL